jgi:hypothetical protein
MCRVEVVGAVLATVGMFVAWMLVSLALTVLMYWRDGINLLRWEKKWGKGNDSSEGGVRRPKRG